MNTNEIKNTNESAAVQENTAAQNAMTSETLYTEIPPISAASADDGIAVMCVDCCPDTGSGGDDGSGGDSNESGGGTTTTIPVTSVVVSSTNRTLNIGGTAHLGAYVYPTNATNREVSWRSTDTGVVTVVKDNIGCKITGISVGKALVIATSTDGTYKSNGCLVTVGDDTTEDDTTTGDEGDETHSSDCTCSECVTDQAIKISAIEVSPYSLEIICGEQTSVNVSVYPSDATNKSVTWTSSDSSIVSVSEIGIVTGHSVGSASIHAIANDGSGISGICNIKVTRPTTIASEELCVCPVDGATVADPVDAYTGAHLLKNNLISLTHGQSLTLTAQYSSASLVKGELGIGWYHNYEKRLEYSEFGALVYNSPSSYCQYVANDEGTAYTCTTAGKAGYILTVDAAAEYPYCINCNYDRYEYYDSNGQLARIVDKHGFETLITRTDTLITVTDSVTGKKIYMEKSGDKISRVYDDASRQTLLTYSGDMLTCICDVCGNTLTYAYDAEGRVLYGTDAKSIRYFENTYDDYGRVISQKDAVGSSPTLFSYDENGVRTITDRNGNTSTRTFDTNGQLIRYEDENGNVKTYTYDSNLNVIEETDGLGHSVKKVYNSFNMPTSVTDKNGNVTTIAYDDAGNVTKISYPEHGGTVHDETFTYNERNQMLTHTDLRGTVTVYTYDTAGLLLEKKVGDKNPTCYSYTDGILTAETDPLGNITRYGHNAIGQVITKTDAQNNITAYEYDLAGNVTKITDPLGKSTVTAYDCNYQKTAVTDANGNKTEFAYNGNLKNTCVTLPDGTAVTYEYDGEDRIAKATDGAGNVTTTVHDKAGRITSKQAPDGTTVAYEYDAAGRVIQETNPKGAKVTKTYDACGNVLTSTDSEGNVTHYQYDEMSRLIRRVNAVSGTTTYTYSTAGDLLTETDALGGVTSYTYDGYGNRLSATDARVNTTTYTYDALGRLITVTDALGGVTTNAYNSLGQLVSVTDAKNHTVTYGYDALGRRTTVTDARGNTFTTYYDAVGNVIKTTDAKGNTVSESVYNSINLPTVVTDAQGNATTYTYNALGKVASVTDSMSNRREFTYNSRGFNTQVKDAANNTSTATYDLLGNVTKLEGPLGGATEYAYDEFGRLTSETTSSGGTKSYEYNALHLKSQLKNARGQVRTFAYDAMGRITGYVGAEDSVSYTYDANGNVLTVTDANGTITRTYDALNRVSSYTDTYGKTIGYEYDAVGNLSKLIYPDNTEVSYEYDANHNLTKVTDWANRVTSYTYDENNRVIGVTKPDGSVTTTVYDNMQRVTSTVEKTAAGVVISGFEYTYDTLGRLVTEKLLANATKMCYTYDNLNRVTARTVKSLSDDSVISTETFTYDAAGNITGGSADDTFVYDINNRLTSFNGNAVSYDLDGNMLSNGVKNFTYDSANRLISAGGHTYTYNAENVRIRNLCTSEDTAYTYDTNCRLSKLLIKTTGSVVTKYIYGLGLICEEVGGSFKTYHFDFRGSTIAITDVNGSITDTFAYDTYGKCTSHIGVSDVIFGYNGRDGVVTDDNGLIYMRARYYSPEMSRFVNADVVAGAISNAITLNRFAYANGNPVSLVDPFGLSAERGDAKTEYESKYYKSKAYDKIKNNASSILFYSNYYGVDPNVVAAVIFVEQYYNYDWVDICTDWVAFYGVIDMSVGLGQVRVSTAEYLEENGYVPETSAKEGGWDIPIIGFIHGTETMAREKRLEDNGWNIMYVAAYIKAIEDYWIEAYPDISSDPGVLGTLYNQGHDFSVPHGNPQPGPFGEDTEYFYELMEEALG